MTDIHENLLTLGEVIHEHDTLLKNSKDDFELALNKLNTEKLIQIILTDKKLIRRLNNYFTNIRGEIEDWEQT
jgi:hypothetical protein